MAPVKLSYFPVRGKGEVPRLIMIASKKEFEDNRIVRSDWPALKPTTTFGVLPTLEVDGEEFHQSMAISTYLARENGLYGTSNMDGLRIEQIQQLREDLHLAEIKIYKEQDEKTKAELFKNIDENTYPKVVGLFNTFIAQNKKRCPGSPYAVGDKLSLADIVIYEGTTTLVQNHPNYLAKYPEVAALRQTVSQQDGLKQYLESRATTVL